MIKLKLLCILYISFFLFEVQGGNEYNSVLSRLASYQSGGGAFRGVNDKPSLEATASALLLSSLYGLNHKINIDEAAKYIASLEADGSYGGSLESVWAALQALKVLSAHPANPSKVSAYIKARLDKDNGLFAVSESEKGSIKGTALALQSLDLLGELDQKWVKDTFPKITQYLTKSKSGDSFKFDDKTSPVTAHYYGTIVSKYVGYDMTAPSWGKFLSSFQSPSGLFYSDATKKSTSLESTAHAMWALHRLGAADTVNLEALKTAVQNIPADIISAFQAHTSLAVTRFFKDNFLVNVHHEGAETDRIMEGASIKPSISIFSKLAERLHSGFHIDSTSTFFGKDSVIGKYLWDTDTQRYIGDALSTAGLLGPASFAHKIRTYLPHLGDLTFDVSETKSVGYSLIVQSKATVELSGKEVREGEHVSVGTDFRFTVTLHNRANENLVTGDFVVSFKVLDSSLATLYQGTIDGVSNKAPIAFTYKLSSSDIPAGKITFQFDISSAKTGKTAHTTRSVYYILSVPMVATSIVLDNKTPTYKFGDKVKVTFEPATFPDLRNTHVLATKDANGVEAERHFALDIKTVHGHLLRSIDATRVKGTSKYSVELTVDPSFDFIGVNALSFRYHPASGEDIVLQNFDATTGELYEDSQGLNFTVKAELSLVDVTESPKAGELVYGADVTYRFRVKDTVSGQHVYVGENQLANIYLDLLHESDGRSFISAHTGATTTGEGKNKALQIKWSITPNAIRGNGTLSLVVTDADGKKLTLKEAKSLPVNIGGDITVSSNTYSTYYNTKANAFIAELSLTCRKQPLKNAELRCTVVHTGSNHEIANLPVAHNDGKYTVSWTSPLASTHTGNYKLLFYREIDRTRAVEQRDAREKRIRKEKQIKGETGTDSIVEGDLQLEPLFVVELPYSVSRFSKIPVRTEMLAVVVFGGLVAWLNKKKNVIRQE